MGRGDRVYGAVVHIEASPEAVWTVLTDLDAYPAWNPFTPRVRSTLRPGDPVVLTVRLGRRTRQQTEYLRPPEGERELRWGLRTIAPWLLRAERVQTVRALPRGGALYETRDTIGGLLAPLVHRLYGRALREGFAAMAEGLKARVEALRSEEAKDAPGGGDGALDEGLEGPAGERLEA